MRRSARTQAAAAKRSKITEEEMPPPPTPTLITVAPEEEDSDDDSEEEGEEGEDGEGDGEEVEGDEGENEDEEEGEGEEGSSSSEGEEGEQVEDQKGAEAAAPAAPADGTAPPPVDGLAPGSSAAEAIAAATASGKKINVRSGVTMTIDEMVHNCVYYFLIHQHKKAPVKRADLLKHAMNGQKKNFDEVMAKFQTLLTDTFGMTVIGLEKGKTGFVNYLIVSDFPNNISEEVTVKSPEADAKRATLFLLLTTMFMQNRHLEEDSIWKLMQDMKFDELICSKREDLQKFLKQEYVTPLYLNVEEIKDSESTVCRYTWGTRSDKEISKWAILKFVAKQFPGMKPDDFDFQFNTVRELEKEKVQEDMAKAEADTEAGQNGSAINIVETAEGAEGFTIEGLPDHRNPLKPMNGAEGEDDEEIEDDEAQENVKITLEGDAEDDDDEEEKEEEDDDDDKEEEEIEGSGSSDNEKENEDTDAVTEGAEDSGGESS